jgi:hypothetical protein
MSVDAVGDIIAERRLALFEANGNSRQAFVRLGKRQESPQGDEYHCPVQFVGLGDEEVNRSFGLDAFQALNFL